MGQRTTGVVEQFDGIVKNRRITGTGGGDGKQFGHVVSEKFRPEQVLPGVHPVDITAQGIDLTVVTQESERMCQIPGGKGVGAVSLVHQRRALVMSGSVRSG